MIICLYCWKLSEDLSFQNRLPPGQEVPHLIGNPIYANSVIKMTIKQIAINSLKLSEDF